MKTLNDAKNLAVSVNELPQVIGEELKNAYLVMLATKKPFFVEYALFVDSNNTYTAYASVVSEKNTNMHNIEFGTDERDYLESNVVSGFRVIEKLLNGSVVGSLSSAFLQDFQAEVI